MTMGTLGYGVYKVPPADTAQLCALALDAGYRTLDTASLYGNESGVGQAVAEALAIGATVREDIFVTTKLWNSDHGYRRAHEAFAASKALLGLDYVDLYLIHWPCRGKGLALETYRALEELYRAGEVRAIGVSNFLQQDLEQLLEHADVVPAVNQVEVHPYLQQKGLRAFHDRHGITTQAWSPLGRGAVLDDPVIGRIAAELGRSPAQVILRWHQQQGVAAVVKASTGTRIAENFTIFEFELTAEQLAAIASLERGQRFGSHPAEVN